MRSASRDGSWGRYTVFGVGWGEDEGLSKEGADRARRDLDVLKVIKKLHEMGDVAAKILILIEI